LPVAAQPPFAEPAHGERIDAVFHRLDARRQADLVVVGSNRHTPLNDRGTAIEFGGDEMHRGAVYRVVRGQHLSMGVQAWVSGQQRRMNVEDPSGIVLDELR
jgi:hypothetical protein